MKIAEVALNKDINVYDFKLLLRNTAKKVMPNLYFEEYMNNFNVKNLGCVIFGQPNTWKGTLRVNPIDNDKVVLELDEKRSKLISNAVVDDALILFNKVLKHLEDKSKIVINWLKDYDKNRLFKNPNLKPLIYENKQDLEDFLQWIITVHTGLEKIVNYCKKYRIYEDISSNIMFDIEIKKLYYGINNIANDILEKKSPINKIKGGKNGNNSNSRQQ